MRAEPVRQPLKVGLSTRGNRSSMRLTSSGILCPRKDVRSEPPLPALEGPPLPKLGATPPVPLFVWAAIFFIVNVNKTSGRLPALESAIINLLTSLTYNLLYLLTSVLPDFQRGIIVQKAKNIFFDKKIRILSFYTIFHKFYKINVKKNFVLFKL